MKRQRGWRVHWLWTEVMFCYGVDFCFSVCAHFHSFLSLPQFFFKGDYSRTCQQWGSKSNQVSLFCQYTVQIGEGNQHWIDYGSSRIVKSHFKWGWAKPFCNDINVSSLTPKTLSNQKSSAQSITIATLYQIYEWVGVGRKRENTLKAINEAVQVDIDSELSYASLNTSSTSACTWPPCHTATQTSYHISMMLANKDKVAYCYLSALIEKQKINLLMEYCSYQLQHQWTEEQTPKTLLPQLRNNIKLWHWKSQQQITIEERAQTFTSSVSFGIVGMSHFNVLIIMGWWMQAKSNEGSYQRCNSKHQYKDKLCVNYIYKDVCGSVFPTQYMSQRQWKLRIDWCIGHNIWFNEGILDPLWLCWEQNPAFILYSHWPEIAMWDLWWDFIIQRDFLLLLRFCLHFSCHWCYSSLGVKIHF